MGKIINAFIAGILLQSCATYTPQTDQSESYKPDLNKEIEHSFYLIGNTALSENWEKDFVLPQLSNSLKSANRKSTLLFLGNSTRDTQTDALHLKKINEGFKGNTVFIPGELEWSTNIGDLRDIEKNVDDVFGKNTFLPERGCPIEEVEISDYIVLIVVDSQWYLSAWNKYPKMNDNCEIKERESFFLEIEGLVKDNLGKTILFAVHHPMFSNGEYGGQYTFGQNMSPLPILGTAKNVLKKTGGFTTRSLQNSEYRTFRRRLTTLARYSDKVIFLSGHEQSLQYIFDKDVHQIISGSGSGKTGVRNKRKGKFGYGVKGFAKLDIFKDGSSQVRFFEAKENKVVYQSQVLPVDKETANLSYPENFAKTVEASIYDTTQTIKKGFHKFLWGDRYRRYYAQMVMAPTVNLDTLFGGVKIVKKGGGHQSLSLRLETKTGKQYVMRALEKSAEAYLQFIVKEDFIIGKTEGLAPNLILKDFYTGDHPFAPFTVAKLADAIGVYHTNPVLYYVPKQEGLGAYNEDFGDKLHMIEEHASDGHGDQKSFGYSNTLISTADLIKNLSSDEKYSVDTDSYIRARLFDMLIGDWDRHNDQWRWAEFEDEKTGDVVYKPVPRDRDQVYSIMGDGFLMGFATRAIPSLKLMEGFHPEIRNVKGFNSSPNTFSLDKYLLPKTHLEDWIEQAKFIQEHIDAELISKAFMDFPIEVQDDTAEDIKEILLSRKQQLQETAKTYFEIISKRIVILGTDKDDYFVVKDIGNGITEVTGHRIKDGKKADVFFHKKIDKKVTKDIWIYGLDDDDYFEVIGGKKIGPKLKLIGGQNNDIYNVKKRRKAKIYDYKGQKNTFETHGGAKRLTDNYNINTYDPFKAKNSINQLIPSIGANPDDGLKIILSDTYTSNGFIQQPFTSQHTFNAAFYFATSGYDFSYTGEFARTLGNASLELALKYTSPNFSINFFGLGNETPNFDDSLDFDFNRVKIKNKSFAPSLIWNGRFGSKFRLGASYESIEVEENDGRFVEDFYTSNTDLVSGNSFLGVDAKYSFENASGGSFPTLGLVASLHTGYKAYLNDESDKGGFGYIIPSLAIDYQLHPTGIVVLASKLKSHINFGEDFEFYQGASIGAEDGLRSYRFQRFTGKSSFYQSTDLRVSLKRVRTSVIPIVVGVYGGFDYGRVWISDDTSNIWHTSYGGGIFVNGLNLITARTSVFGSDDGARINFGLGFSF